MLVPFFKAGVDANECGLWITVESLPAIQTTEALARVVEDLPERMQKRQIQILDYQDWYLRSEGVSAEGLLREWLAQEAMARGYGYDGLRVTGDTFWVERKDWDDFVAYEATVHRAFHSQRIIALCSYSLNKCTAGDIIDVLRNHGSALVRRNGQWESIQSATQMLATVKDSAPVEPPRVTSPSARTAANDWPPPAAAHAVRFFQEPDYPAEDIGRRTTAIWASALLEDYVKQIGLAMERSLAYGAVAEDLRPVHAGQANDRAQGGLGLGLTLARNITEMHGGRLYGKSEGPGKGAEFVLELPLLAPVDSTAATFLERTVQTMTPDRKILVVDDNTDAADSLAEALQMLGHVVEVAYDGPSALRVAPAFQPDLALLDIGLPAMDGYELGQQLRASLNNARLKLIALTGYGKETDRRRTADAGFDRHLVKPVDFDRLQAVIEELSPKAQQLP